MPNWDIFHSDRLEVERNLTEAAIREGAADGVIVPADLARPANSGEPWVRLAEHPRLSRVIAGRPSGAKGPSAPRDDDESDEFEPPPAAPVKPQRRGEKVTGGAPLPSGVRKGTTEDLDPAGFPDSYDRDLDLSLRDPKDDVPLGRDRGDDLADYDPAAEDEAAAEFTFTRGSSETVEELDLAAMVDVAFQLVLFFLVTASTIVFKAIEVPKPKADDKKGGSATQANVVSLDEAAKEFILVEIDAAGAVKIDHENSPNDFAGLAAKLREIRDKTGRLSMLLKAEPQTKHKNAVNMFDVASEIGLGIAVASVKSPAEKPPGAPPPPVVPPANTQ